MRAFEAAVALGYTYIETDVQATADGVLIAFHDETLDRVTDHVGPVAAMTWAQLRAVRIAGTEPVARFDELLEAMPDIRFNVDAKVDCAVEPLIAAVRRAGALDRLCFGAVSDTRVARIRHALGPGACSAFGTREVAALRVLVWGVWPFRAPLLRRPGQCVQVPVQRHGVTVVDAGFVATAHDLELPVHVWTINDSDEMERLLDLGVDGLMTDRPALLRDVLIRRGAWGSDPKR
ncbi:MAG: glycerophosphodiester phosphodiesterase family protein [Chloroflexota bacterium]